MTLRLLTAAPCCALLLALPLSAQSSKVVRVDSLGSLAGTGLTEKHEVEVYLPPGYDDAPTRRYPVLYSNDGQALAVMDLPTLLTTEIFTGQMAPIIIVAIHSTQARTDEYALAGQRARDSNGAAASAYQQFILTELMPMIEGRYRVLKGPRGTAMMGFSFGALSAFDMVWNHPERFGLAGLFSGSFWWRDNDGTAAERQAGRLAHRMVKQGSGRPGLRFWFMSARQEETDDRDGNGVIDAIQDADELIDVLEQKGYHRGGDIGREVVDGDHSVQTWARTLPDFLHWAYPTGN